MELLSDAEFWVGIGTVVLIGLVIWKKVPALATRALDARAASIAKELAEAKRLHDEAAALLTDYRRKTANAEKEAESIVAEARAEAERYAKESRVALDTQIERRAKMAQDKIAQAEAQAIAEVRTLAADAAAAAAEKLISARLDEKRSAAYIAEAIKEIPGKLN